MICFNDQLNAVRWAKWGSSTRPAPMRSWTFICTVIKPADFLQDKRKKGRGYQAPKFLPQTRSGLLFVTLFSCHCALWRICWTPPHLHHHLFVPLEESGEGGRSHQLSANGRMCSHSARWNGPIKIKRFKPNRYIVNVVGSSKVRRNSQTGWLYGQKLIVNCCLHGGRQQQVWFTVG